jgi:hypothetical protein
MIAILPPGFKPQRRENSRNLAPFGIGTVFVSIVVGVIKHTAEAVSQETTVWICELETAGIYRHDLPFDRGLIINDALSQRDMPAG